MGSHEEVDAVAIAHPGGIEYPKDFEALIRPSLFLCAELEFSLPDSDRDGGKEILEKRGIYNKFVIYRGAAHGFAVINLKTVIDGIRFEEMKTMRRKRRQWRRRRMKPSPSLASFSIESGPKGILSMYLCNI
jgi:dienelactone hydrolase